MPKPSLKTKQAQRSIKDGVAVIAGSAAGGPRKLRDPLGHGLAVPTLDEKGKQVFRSADGRTFTSRKF
jgi:hypothetical protein